MSIDSLEKLAADAPELMKKIQSECREDPLHWPLDRQAELAAEIYWALSQGAVLGEIYALGLIRLMCRKADQRVEDYKKAVHEAALNGLTLSLIMAEHFLPVLLWGQDDLIHHFQQTVAILLSKGTYTLKPPLETESWLIERQQSVSAHAFLSLLQETFSKEMSYNLSLKFSYLLPRAVRSFEFSKNHFQIRQLTRVVAVDFVLAERFILGLESGLSGLDQKGLEKFVTLGLEKYNNNVVSGRKFFALSSHAAQTIREDLQISASLKRLRLLLERTIRVRVGEAVAVRSLSEVDAWLNPGDRSSCYVASDGNRIFLREEIADFDQKPANEMLYKLLAKLESAAIEFGTFDFDLDRYKSCCDSDFSFSRVAGRTDFEVFINQFSQPQLAWDLFNIFEQERLRHRLEQKYPGLARTAFQFLQDRVAAEPKREDRHFLTPLYEAAAFGCHTAGDEWFSRLCRQSERALSQEVPVENVALLTKQSYNSVASYWKSIRLNRSEPYPPLCPLYGRRIQPDLLQRTWAAHEKEARRIRRKLLAQNVSVYQSEIRKHLIRHNGDMAQEDLTRIILSGRSEGSTDNCAADGIDLSTLDLSSLSTDAEKGDLHTETSNGNVWRYKEWDCRVSDYIHEHVRVVDQNILGEEDLFYVQTLSLRAGLVSRMRKAFELLKPEGLTLLRQWVEGDDFDYRALIDFALDRKAGLMPSDRLYIKRVKQNRDVAVLLLVDVSRSTAHCVAGTKTPVLSIQKEAIVLFCEALKVVGDDFAIAGFSGSGRLNVDYFRFKDFGEPLTQEVKQRIGGIRPQRSTRMGAAIRHGAADLMQCGEKVKLMLILSDGFPNDTDYKGEYAVADTRTAVLEARAKNMVVKAITVNMGADVRLNDLYGSAHHHVIEDVRDLPDQLLRMYGKLTRI